MTTKITVPLSEVDEQFLKELKEKHPSHARLHIQVVDMDNAPALDIMNIRFIEDRRRIFLTYQGGKRRRSRSYDEASQRR